MQGNELFNLLPVIKFFFVSLIHYIFKIILNRYDYPKEWPELLPSLLHLVRTEDDLVQQRALLYLHHVTKSLASKRLAGDRRAFQDLSSEMYSYVYALYSHLSQTLMQQVSIFIYFLLRDQTCNIKDIKFF